MVRCWCVLAPAELCVVMQGLRNFDIFPKFDSRFEQEARDKTVFGAVLSVVAVLLVLVLVGGEVSYFFSIETKHELFVDTSDVNQQLTIHINVSFFKTPCDLISIDAIDSFGEFQKDIEATTRKHRISNDGTFIAETVELVNSGKKSMRNGEEEDHASAAGHRDGCGSCYGAGAAGSCCNSCDDVREAYERHGWTFNLNDVSIVQCAAERLAHASRIANHEGCNIAGTLAVRRVQGNIHFIPGRSFTHLGQHLHDLAGDEVKDLNLTHRINHLSFGDSYPGLVNPLDGRTNAAHTNAPPPTAEDAAKADPNSQLALVPSLPHHAKEHKNPGVDDSHPFGGGKFQYFIKVVPTWYDKLDGTSVKTNQYSCTEHYSAVKTDMQFIPGMFVLYDLSPIMVHAYEARPYSSVVHFLLELCAITGGVFTVAGIVDSFLYHGARQVKRKMMMGKQG